MFINANEIIKLIQACKDVKAKLPLDEQKIHVDDIAATLQNLIDEEASRLEIAVGMGEVKFPPRRRERNRRAERLTRTERRQRGERLSQSPSNNEDA